MKRILTFLSLVLFISVYGQTKDEGLLLHYPFSGNSNDISGNNYDGICNATLTVDRYGNTDSAYSFNGVDEYIDFPNVSQLEPELPVSISLWVKFDDLDETKTTVFTTDFAQNNHSGIWMNVTAQGYLSIAYGDASGNTTSANRRTKHGSTVLNTDIWYHIIVIIRGPHEMDIYIDCVYENGYYYGTGGDLGYTSNPGSIGRKDAHTSYPAYYFKGSVDDFRYWNRELTFNEIEYICNSLSSNEEHFNENDIIIYPNPANEFLYIEAVNKNKIEKIVLRNTMGQVIYKGTFNSKIAINHLKQGVYFLQAINNEGEPLKIFKFVKE